jgi:hypothetical protein
VDQILNNVGLPDHALLAEAGLDAPGVSSVERLAATIARGARASAIFGEPIHQGASVVIPVAKAIWGVGGGKGPAGTGDGGGGGMHVAPVGYIHVEHGRARSSTQEINAVAWRDGRFGWRTDDRRAATSVDAPGHAR